MNARKILALAALSCLCLAPVSAQQPEKAPIPKVIITQGSAEALLIAKVEPDYPDAVKSKGIAGQIVIAFTIGRDGSVSDVRPVDRYFFACRPVNSDDPELQQAAIAAVKQWRYVPFRLHDVPGDQGEPIEAATAVALPFDFRKPDPASRAEAAASNAPAGMAACNPPADGAATTKFMGPQDPKRAKFGRPVIDPKQAEERLTHRVEAKYPLTERPSLLQGNAVLHVLIDKQGHVAGIKPESGHPILVKAALDAVKQWEYQPFQLNGETVEVETAVVIKFRCEEEGGKSCTQESGSACRCSATN